MPRWSRSSPASPTPTADRAGRAAGQPLDRLRHALDDPVRRAVVADRLPVAVERRRAVIAEHRRTQVRAAEVDADLDRHALESYRGVVRGESNGPAERHRGIATALTPAHPC